MNKEHIKKELASLTLSMFRKDFFGIYHGSISAKLESNLFTINTKDAIFDTINESNLIDLFYKKDYRWKEASMDASIHLGIYQNISDAKFISFTMPPYTTAYSIDHSVIVPKDYFGYQELGKLPIYDPKQFDDWYDRAVSEIPYYLTQNSTNIIIIKGYGVYAFNRDLSQMAKQLAILEKSCRLLMLDSSSAKLDLDF
ncbi:MAG TPA: hypothetical protein ENK65_01320 [Helicobacteraceae bacterium]|nr:hypothetical protein [Helicobacteraceae bacterium]